MITRRGFARRAAWLGAAWPAWTEAALAQRALIGDTWSPNTVWLNANENPDGPSRAAIEAMNRVVPESWRYHYPEFRELVKDLKTVNGQMTQFADVLAQIAHGNKE